MPRLIVGSVLLVLWAMLPLAASAAGDGKVHVLWTGQATVRITSPGGKVIVIDPFLLKNPKTPEKYKDLKALGKVDLVLVTHGHFDHTADAVELAKLNAVMLSGPVGLLDTMSSLGIIEAKQTIRMNKTGTVTPLGPEIRFTQVGAEHSSELAWTDPMTGKPSVYYGGMPIGWIVRLENGFTIYHLGDTGLFSEMALIGSYYKPDLILIPIGGHFTMGPEEAAYATREMIKPKHALPFHYGTFPPLKGTPEEYMKALGNTATKVHPISPGEELVF